jgi:hypothetical protein
VALVPLGSPGLNEDDGVAERGLSFPRTTRGKRTTKASLGRQVPPDNGKEGPGCQTPLVGVGAGHLGGGLLFLSFFLYSAGTDYNI